jgi:HPt (histidine-containing phosphotransfer) domain-containing protein
MWAPGRLGHGARRGVPQGRSLALSLSPSAEPPGIRPIARAQRRLRSGTHSDQSRVSLRPRRSSTALSRASLTSTRPYRQGFTRAAHTLKSSSSYVGAKRFAELAAAIERASPDAAGADLAGQIARLEQEYVHVKAALEEVRSGS